MQYVMGMKTLFLMMILPFALTAFQPNPITPFPVLGYRELPFFDEYHKIDRKIIAWYPVESDVVGKPSHSPWDLFHVALNASILNPEKKKPVIFISHGYTGQPHQLSWLVLSLVYKGFIVISIQHRDLIESRAHINHWLRPRDIHVGLDVFAKSALGESADLENVGIAGYSLGGTTAIWIAGGRATKLDTLIPSAEFASPEDYVRANEALSTLNKEMMSKNWRDDRIKAAFVIAPAWSWLFDEKSLNQISIPVYLIATEGDKVLISKRNAGFFAKFIPNAIYQEIPGKAGHYVFISFVSGAQRKSADPSGRLNFLFEEDVSISRQWIQYQTAEEASRFFHSVLGP